MMNRTLQRLICLVACLILCLGCLPACAKQASALTKSGIESVTLIKKQKLSIEVRANKALLEEHKKEKLFLYELLPGETLSDLQDKQPLAKKKVSASLTFEIPLEENGIDRRYSSFVTAFADGTVLETEAKWVKNPTFLATNHQKAQWAGAPKGLALEDPESAWSLGVSHGLLSLRLSALLDGGEVYAFGGNEYTYSEACLEQLDSRIKAARATGMQITLELIPDLLPSADTAAAMLDLLSERYTGEQDLLFVYMIDATGLEAEQAAMLAHTAHLALRSRTANGRVSVEYGGAKVEDAKAFFLSIHHAIATRGSFEWDACIRPVCHGSSQDGALTPDQLPDFFRYLRGNDFRNPPVYLSVNGLQFESKDGDKQLLNLAYAYRFAVSAGASTVFYGVQNDDLCGLFDSEGKETLPLADVYKQLDTELSAEYTALFDSLTDGAFGKLDSTSGRTLLQGTTALGSDGKEYELLYDFSEQNTHGFDVIGGIGSTPECVSSAALGRPVLFTWLNSGSTPTGEGIRQLLKSGSSLQGAFSLSARMLMQNDAAASSRVTLRLEGASRMGRRITYEATATVENGRWQTVIFYIAPFIAEADLSSPCILTLSAESDAPVGTQYPLWVDNFSIRRPAEAQGPLSYVLLIAGCAIVGLGLPLALYQVIRIRRLRRARRGR